MNGIPFPKQYMSPQQLVELLQSRGLYINDRKYAEAQLRKIGYYRLSAYLYPLLSSPKTEQQFKTGSKLSSALTLYDFDFELRIFLFRYIAQVEVAIRSAMANIIANETGNIFWMTDKTMFAKYDRYTKTMEIIDHELRHSNEEFISHFKFKYTDPYPPAWMLTEILPMGVLNHIYSNLSDNKLRKKIAAAFSLPVPVFNSWLTIIILTRNACCHHARVWNKENAIRPIKPNKLDRGWIANSISSTRVVGSVARVRGCSRRRSPEQHHQIAHY